VTDVNQTASDRLAAVSDHAAKMAAATDGLEHGYASLGFMILEVAEMQYWRLGFESFTDYLISVSEIVKKSIGQLKQYLFTVRDLSQVFNRQQLETMGIGKAILLRKTKDYALVFPQTIIDAALDQNITTKDLKTIIENTLHIPKDEEPGEWIDLSFLGSPEDVALVGQAMLAARREDPIIKETLEEQAQIAECVRRWCMNYLADYGGNL
jgi:hypothetical protein